MLSNKLGLREVKDVVTMTEKEIMLGGTEKKKLNEVRYYYVPDEDVMDSLPAMPSFLDLLKAGYFTFNFGNGESLYKSIKGYTNERNFVIYGHPVPFNEEMFQELADKSHEFPFERLILISQFRPETILGEKSQKLIDKVSTIDRTGNIFSIETESAESYFDNVEMVFESDYYSEIYNEFIAAEEKGEDLSELLYSWFERIDVDFYGLDYLYMFLIYRQDYWTGKDDALADWYKGLKEGVERYIKENPLLSQFEKDDYLNRIVRGE